MSKILRHIRPRYFLRILSAACISVSLALSPSPCHAADNSTALAAGKEKYLGSIWQPEQTFLPIWNQMTPGNAAKWGSVQGKLPNIPQGVDNLTEAYGIATERNIPFKAHTLLWARSMPKWATELKTEAEFKAKFREWLALIKSICPHPTNIDVVNEPFGEAMKLAWGKGGMEPEKKRKKDRPEWQSAQPMLTTEQRDDLIIWAYKEARAVFPDSDLLINEFNVIVPANIRPQYIELIKKILAAGPVHGRPLVNGIGLQFHHFETNRATPEIINASLDELATLGLDLHISELSVDGIGGDPKLTTEEVQKLRYQTVFPAIWKHPKVKGVTVWGYNTTSTFDFDRNGYDGIGLTKLVNGKEVEKDAMLWLRAYVKDNP